MAKTRSKHQKELYTAYAREQRWAKNRRRKLERVLKEQPNNLQVAEALKNIKYRRKTPGTSILSTQEKEMRGVIATLKNKRVSAAKANIVSEKPNVKRMFSLGTRAHTQDGQFPWKS